MALKEKLDPARYPHMSTKMAAIVGCILREKYTDPQLVELVVTSDGFLMGRPSTSLGFDAFLGTRGELVYNWRRLLDAANLTDEERVEADALFEKAVQTC